MPAAPARPPAPRPSPAGDGGVGAERARHQGAETEVGPEAAAPEDGLAEALGSIAGPPSAGLAEALGSIAGPAAPPRPDVVEDPADAPDMPESAVRGREPGLDEELPRAAASTQVRAPADPGGPGGGGLGLGPDVSGFRLDGLDRDPDAEPVGEIGDITVDPLFGGTRAIRTNRRASLRREFNEVSRTRVAMIIVLVLVVLGAPLTFYATREAGSDPMFGHLSGLAVPGWAARDAKDETTGSRWCIGECQLRQRILRSERNPEETSAVYVTALRKAGWAEWKIEGCPSTDQGGFETCWQRDEYVLDLWVYQPECEVQLKVPDPSQPATPLAEAVCPPTVVTLKVINKVSFET
ncbi:hypothetical protein [Virgisporangium aurantiacum]|uniref:Uncharacterized protein n=1 Tax=Virgisporangium aurantiacum TaxID=175570 RepID=A0A8J3ZAK3_9ACTN|nr:hypothetical protein [Virgisporangium aurantiacum]GIJ58176.1 hypothetical protein Vau01_056920 [Virgisporangium aurantiacum]